MRREAPQHDRPEDHDAPSHDDERERDHTTLKRRRHPGSHRTSNRLVAHDAPLRAVDPGSGVAAAAAFADAVNAGIHPAGSSHELLRAAQGLDRADGGGAFAGRLGLGDVAVHRGEATRAALAKMGARGATVGGSVFVGDEDPHVLAHELAHVAQRRHRGPAKGSDAEADADRVADALLAGGTASPETELDTDAIAFYPGRITTDGVRLRSAPGGEQIGRLRSGESVEVLDEPGGEFVHVRRGTQEGWVSHRFLERADAPQAPAAQQQQQQQPAAAAPTISPGPARLTSTAALRGTAEPTSPIVERLARGTFIKVLAVEGEYANVSHGDVSGYVPVRNIGPVGDTSRDEVRRDIQGDMGVHESSGRAGHYSATDDRVNIGLGSWTGNRVGGVMDRYLEAANTEERRHALFAHFGDSDGAHFRAIRARFRGVDTEHPAPQPDGSRWYGPRLTPEEIQQFETAEAALPWIRQAEMEQLDADFSVYARHIAALHPPWPFIQDGTISELAMAVLSNAQHQHPDMRFVEHMIAASPNATEQDLLRQVAEGVARAVRASYADSVRHRYQRIFARYGNSPRRYPLAVPERPATTPEQHPQAAQPEARTAQPEAQTAQPQAQTAQPQAQPQTAQPQAQAAQTVTATRAPALTVANFDASADPVASLRSGRFLGVGMRAHPILLDRLAIAEQYLVSQHHAEGEALRHALGVDAGYSVHRAGDGYHHFGLAIDINYNTNPYVGGQGGRHAEHDRAAVAAIYRAAWLTGGTDTLSSQTSWSQRHGGTDALYDHFQGASQALEHYLAARNNPEQVARWIAARNLDRQLQIPAGVPASLLHIDELRTADAATWLRQIQNDFTATHATSDSNWERTGAGQRRSLGFMNLNRDLVHALREVAGLAWGAADFGENANGDFMHFDARHVVPLGVVRPALRAYHDAHPPAHH